MEPINLWLDDYRHPPLGWVWVKTVADAQTWLKTGRVQRASLDHDLGACKECMRGMTLEEWLDKHKYVSAPNCEHYGTGYDLCLWMARTGCWPHEKPTVHSLNPVGHPRMVGVIDRYFPHTMDKVESI